MTDIAICIARYKEAQQQQRDAEAAFRVAEKALEDAIVLEAGWEAAPCADENPLVCVCGRQLVTLHPNDTRPAVLLSVADVVVAPLELRSKEHAK